MTEAKDRRIGEESTIQVKSIISLHFPIFLSLAYVNKVKQNGEI